MAYISGAVEGLTDRAVLERLVREQGSFVHRVQVKQGKANLRSALPGYNGAANGDPWLVLVDLDNEFDCAARLVSNWLPAPSRYMRLRVAVRQIEAWLLGDAERFGRFFAVPPAAIPPHPDELPNARGGLLAAIARSRREAVKVDMLPRPRSGRQVGPAYTSWLMEFAANEEFGWRPGVAAERSPSLAKCLERLRELIGVAP